MPRIAWSAADQLGQRSGGRGPHQGGLKPLHPLGRGARDGAVVIEHDLVGHLGERDPLEPGLVGAAPGADSRRRVDRPAQQELGEPVACPQLVGLGIVAGTDEIAQRLTRLVGDPDRCEVAAAQQSGELGRVAPVGLDPVAGLGRDERRGDDDALDAERGELAVERVAGRAGLVGDAQPGVRPQGGPAACGSPPGRSAIWP